MQEVGVLTLRVCFYISPFELTSTSPVYGASTKWIWGALTIDLKKYVTSCQDAVCARREVWSTSRSGFEASPMCQFPNDDAVHTRCQLPNDAGLDTRCQFLNDAGLHTSQVKSSSVPVLVALVKAERKHAAAPENVAKFLKMRKEQSDALFTQAKQEMEEARKKLADAEQAKRLMLSKTVVNPNFHS